MAITHSGKKPHHKRLEHNAISDFGLCSDQQAGLSFVEEIGSQLSLIESWLQPPTFAPGFDSRNAWSCARIGQGISPRRLKLARQLILPGLFCVFLFLAVERA